MVLLVKRLTARDSSTTIVLFQTLFLTVFSLPPALRFWRIPSLESLLLVASIGALGTIAWLCFTRAFALADASAVMSYGFLKLPMTALLAYLIFAEVPSTWTWSGVRSSSAQHLHRPTRGQGRTGAGGRRRGRAGPGTPLRPRA